MIRSPASCAPTTFITVFTLPYNTLTLIVAKQGIPSSANLYKKAFLMHKKTEGGHSVGSYLPLLHTMRVDASCARRRVCFVSCHNNFALILVLFVLLVIVLVVIG
ncbi:MULTISPECIES: YjcZ family sporulation protein [unclassified Brevibacillus]|uniref:YjcZ family sporulation protein n=1 Tax=Brevibacillus TaxID=55080 RepID=UPI003341E23B|nr:YjcZ family sporulation protein [Brevibacillus brevis]